MTYTNASSIIDTYETKQNKQATIRKKVSYTKISKSKIEVLLAESQLTKNEFAEVSGISRQFLCNVLAKERCSPKTAGRIAHALNAKVTEIIETED